MTAVQVYPNTGEHVVDVYSICDLPPPVAGVISLVEGCTYHLHEIVDIGTNTIMCPDHIRIHGTTSTNTGFTGATVGALLSTPATGVHLVLYGTSLRQTGTGPIMDLAHTGTDTVLEITHCLLQAAGGLLANSACDFATIRFTVMRGYNDGWHVMANGSAFSVISCLGIGFGAGPMWDLNSSVIGAWRWQNSTYVGLGGGLLFSGLAGSANVGVGGQARVTDVSWIGAAPLDLIDTQDIRWQFKGCSGVRNSYGVHHTRMSDNVVATTFGAPDVYVLAAGVSTSDPSPRFDDNGGISHTIRCLGEIVSPSVLTVGFRVNKSGSSRSYSFGIFKNGTILGGGAEETFDVPNSPDITYNFSSEDPDHSVGDVYDVRVRPNGHSTACTVISLRLSFQSN